MTSAHNRFQSEIRHFFRVSLLNLVFAALAIAFGVSYGISAITGQGSDPAGAGLRIVTGAIALAGFGLGIAWLLATVRIFRGIRQIREDSGRDDGGAADNERTTCHIVRMISLYRDNRATINRMILVCTLGGICFFILGITAGLRALTITPAGGSFTANSLLVLPGMLLTLGIALVSLVSSFYFSRFARAWDLRLGKIDASENSLKETLDREGS